MKITLVQMAPKLGNIEYNTEKILDLYNRAGGEIVLFPELSLTGYHSKDLMLTPNFINLCQEKLMQIMRKIGAKICIIGLPIQDSGKLFNAMFAIKNGQVIAKSTKVHLACGDVFDENRYFSSGKTGIFEHDGQKFALPICEDIWHEDVCLTLKKYCVDCFLVSNASPFYIGKHKERIQIVQKRYQQTQIPIIYCNQVVNQDGILYDGSSFCYDGKDIVQLESFAECLLDVDFVNNKFIGRSIIQTDDATLTHKALVFGLKQYVYNSGFAKVLIGLSGGADSALVASLATSAFGAGNVHAVFMPSKFTSTESFEDAISLAKNLGLQIQIIPIEKPFQTFSDILTLTGLALENIQARIRGNILMAISNQINAMVLTTGNKSEVATGYCTIYGDMCGGYNPIKDLYKTQVFEVMRYINSEKIATIPERIITKEPTAELHPNQKDSDFLPPYQILDGILKELVENRKIPDEITNFDYNTVVKVFKLLKNTEYKRRQSPPGTKLSKQSFEQLEWRWNIN